MGYPPTHRQKARELHGQGKSIGEIAKELKVASKATVHAWIHAPEPIDAPAEPEIRTENTERTERDRTHSKSKSKSKDAVDDAMLQTIRELEVLGRDKPVDMSHPAVTSPDVWAARLEILAWDIATALRAVIPYADVKMLAQALKVSLEMARLIQGKATAIQEMRVVGMEVEQRREQLANRVRGLSERLQQRAGPAGIRGVVDGGEAAGGAGRAAADS